MGAPDPASTGLASRALRPVRRLRSAVQRHGVRGLARLVVGRLRPRPAVRTAEPTGPSTTAVAVRRALTGGSPQVEGAEGAVLEAVERRRAQLLADDRQIEVISFGAGRPTASRTAEEMDAGIRTAGTVAGLCARAVSKPSKARRLYRLVRELRPARVLEMGSSFGISTAYLAAALEANGRGDLIALEGAPSIAAIAAEGLDELGLGRARIVPGRSADTLAESWADGVPLDLVFVDGHHDGPATIDYFEQLLPHAAPGAVLVFDDIRWSDSMLAAWERIAADPRCAEVIDADRIGAVVLGAGTPSHTG
jgi:predicted O-methyltransferase YrrM